MLTDRRGGYLWREDLGPDRDALHGIINEKRFLLVIKQRESTYSREEGTGEKA